MIEPPDAARCRYEIKLPIPACEIDAWRMRLRLHPAGLRRHHPTRRIHNLYFDTPDLDTLADSLAGIGQRAKLRYRWYGESPVPVAGRFERKCKRDSVGWKEVFEVAAPDAGSGWRALRESIAATLPEATRLILAQHPSAVLTNRYRREYLVTSDGDVRVTLDSELTTIDQRGGDAIRLRGARSSDAAVIEVKCSLDRRDAARAVLAELPGHVGRFSKYVRGAVESGYGGGSRR